jgi:hypothetical protein
VVEKWDFARKKAEREAVSRRKARMLSSLAYNRMLSGLKAACFCEGVGVITVNPAYTSVIAAVNLPNPKGFLFIRARRMPSPVEDRGGRSVRPYGRPSC